MDFLPGCLLTNVCVCVRVCVCVCVCVCEVERELQEYLGLLCLMRGRKAKKEREEIPQKLPERRSMSIDIVCTLFFSAFQYSFKVRIFSFSVLSFLDGTSVRTEYFDTVQTSSSSFHSSPSSSIYGRLCHQSHWCSIGNNVIVACT